MTHPAVQVVDLGRYVSSRANEPGCPKCGAPVAWIDSSGTTHHRCRSIVSEGMTVARCREGSHYG